MSPEEAHANMDKMCTLLHHFTMGHMLHWMLGQQHWFGCHPACEQSRIVSPDFGSDGEGKGAEVQEEDSVHGLVVQAMQPPHMEHMCH